MKDSVWDEDRGECEWVRAAEIRCASRAVCCILFAAVALATGFIGFLPSVKAYIYTALCIATYIVCFREVNSGISALFRNLGSDDSFRSVALASVAVHSVAMIFASEKVGSSYAWIVFLSFAAAHFTEFLLERETEKNIGQIDKRKLIGAETAPSDMRRRKEMNLCITSDLEKPPEISEISRRGDPSRQRNKGFVPVCIAISAVAAATAAILGGAALFLTAFSAMMCICSGFAGEASSRMPYIASQKKLRRYGCIIPGYGSLKRLCKCDTFVVRDSDFFPEGTVKTVDIKFRRGFNAARSIEYLFALLTAAGSPAAYAIKKMIKFDTALTLSADDMHHIRGDGYACVIDGHTVIAGNRNLMLAAGVPPLSQEREAAVKSSTRPLMYLAVDGQLAAMVLFQYMADKELKSVLRTVGSSFCIVIDTFDCNISENLVRRAYKNDSLRVIVPDADERRFVRKVRKKIKDRPPRPAAIVCEKANSIFIAAYSARRVAAQVSAELTLKQVSTVAGVIITAIAAFMIPGALSPLWVLLFDLIWLIPVLVPLMDNK